MKLIVDTQLPPLLAHILSEKGLDVIHTTFFSDGHLLQDQEIISIAIEQDRIVISKDKDFFENYLLKGIPPKILLLEFGNIKNNELLQLFRLNIKTIVALFKNGAELIKFSRNHIQEYSKNGH